MEIIAEVGSVHDGSFGNALKLIDLAKECGATTAKFQLHSAEHEMVKNAPSPEYFSTESRFDYFERLSFSNQQWRSIRAHCESVGIKFGCSIFSIEALQMLTQDIGVDVLKIPSGEVTNIPLIEECSKFGDEIYLSTGMGSWEEIDKAVKILERNNLSIFQCTSIYPTAPKKVGLNVIKEMKDRYARPIGFSDHTLGIEFPIAAVALGATIIEKHLTFSRKMYGSDAFNALEPAEFKAMSTCISNINESLESPVDKNDLDDLVIMKKTFQKSIYASKRIKIGSIITRADLVFLKPDEGISAAHYKELYGRKAARNIEIGEVIHLSDLI